MNAKRVMASVLAGAMVLSLPLTVAAKDETEGGAVADSNLISAQEKKYFDVVLPTNTVSNINFQLDPLKKIGNVEGLSATNYNTNTQLYFKRTDYELIPNTSADDLAASDIWGKIVNIPTGGKIYDNTSNWMTVKNKSAQPVMIELAASWTTNSKVEVVSNPNDLVDKDTAKPQIYMAIQAAVGHTEGEIAGDPDGNGKGLVKTAENVVGQDKNLVQYDEQGNKIRDITDGDGLLISAYDKIENGKMKPISLVHTDNRSGAKYSTYNGLVTRGDKTVYLSYYLPTVNTTYTSTGVNIYDIEYVDPVVKAYEDEGEILAGDVNRKKRAFYLESIGKEGQDISINLRDNRRAKLPGNVTNDTPYDEYVNVYPTFAFRLTGEINKTSQWATSDKPRITLGWKVTLGVTEGVRIPVMDPDVIDLQKVIDDLRYVDITLNDATLDSITWEGQPLWSLKDGPTRIDASSLGAGFLDMVTVDDVNKAAGTQRVWIRQISLMNWSNGGYFLEKGGPNDANEGRIYVDFNFILSDGTKQPVTLTILDSGNHVNLQQ